jgi:hypothetical protein
MGWSSDTNPFKPNLPEAATQKAKDLAVRFDFDNDSCFPDAAIYRDGTQNPGLEISGTITGGCRNRAQLTNSNTYHRSVCVDKDGVEYCVHMYALYFEKDQVAPYRWIKLVADWGNETLGLSLGRLGHKHDVEYALVWTTNGEVTHGSYSSHGKVTTKSKSNLAFDDDHLKIVYHKDDGNGGTHAFRFADRNDISAENPLGRYFTPALVDWYQMKGDRDTNAVLREKANKEYDYGPTAEFHVNDKRFPGEIVKGIPDGYPGASEWEGAVIAMAYTQPSFGEPTLLGSRYIPESVDNRWNPVVRFMPVDDWNVVQINTDSDLIRPEPGTDHWEGGGQSDLAPVPEPTTSLLVGLGTVGLLALTRKRRQRKS